MPERRWFLTLSPPISLEPQWLAPHVGYTIAKYGMTLCALGLAAEFFEAGDAVLPEYVLAEVHVPRALSAGAGNDHVRGVGVELGLACPRHRFVAAEQVLDRGLASLPNPALRTYTHGPRRRARAPRCQPRPDPARSGIPAVPNTTRKPRASSIQLTRRRNRGQALVAERAHPPEQRKRVDPAPPQLKGCASMPLGHRPQQGSTTSPPAAPQIHSARDRCMSGDTKFGEGASGRRRAPAPGDRV